MIERMGKPGYHQLQFEARVKIMRDRVNVLQCGIQKKRINPLVMRFANYSRCSCLCGVSFLDALFFHKEYLL